MNRLKVFINVNTGNSIEELIENVTSITFKELLNCIFLLNEDGSNFKTSINGFSKFINDAAVVENDNDKSMILKDIDELQAHWYNYATKTERKTLTSFKNSMALGQTHPLSQGNGITLSTVHTMKGQEYEIVFLIGMDDETFPDYRAIKAGGIEMTQEKNNLYVAFTRAKRFLFVTWPKERLMPWGDVKRRKISRLLEAL
ncbi:MAG TPA: 3'-5' exonuclease [Saprospiraceae bacterium]|nr:3'-5' exonuclease [Saprospiraceae bacterium]